MMKFFVAIACAIGALAVAIAIEKPVRAAEPMHLPDFDLTAVDGRTVRSQDLERGGKWLLIYVQPNCRPCDRC